MDTGREKACNRLAATEDGRFTEALGANPLADAFTLPALELALWTSAVVFALGFALLFAVLALEPVLVSRRGTKLERRDWLLVFGGATAPTA